MLDPEGTLREIVEALVEESDRVGLTLDDYISKRRARMLVVQAIRATHQILHPGCRFEPASCSSAIERLERGE